MARSVFLWIENADKGTALKEQFLGRGGSSVDSLERGGTVECLYFDMSGEAFFNSQTGEQTGNREFKPVVIRKQIDQTSALFWRALAEGWAFKATFRVYEFTPGETERCCFTIVLDKARVVGVRMYVPTTGDETEGNPLPAMEEVKFTFADVTWTGEFDKRDGTDEAHQALETHTTWKGDAGRS